MKLAIVCNEHQKQEFLTRKTPGKTELCFVSAPASIPSDSQAVFDLLFEPSPERISELKNLLPRPVFINAVTHTLRQVGQPFVRINAWPGFLHRGVLEMAAAAETNHHAQVLLQEMDWASQLVPDQAGMISARVVAMMINEAYFTLAAGVSEKAAIDTAMKLGTNYPYGPFEWAQKIGLRNILELLVSLGKENNLYMPCDLLTQEASSNNIK